jgi:hypothetical protein
MPKLVKEDDVFRAPLNQRPRLADGGSVQRKVEPAPAPPAPPVERFLPAPTVNVDMGAIADAIRDAAADLKPKSGKPRTFEFKVTERDANGKVLKFTVSEK